MDRRERIDDPEETLRMAFEGWQARLWTAMPGIIQTFDAEKMTCSVQPSITGNVRQQDGTFTTIRMPLLLDCPVQFQGGGGATLTFPLKEGDECLVVFASRCIDAWWSYGGVQDQAELRMHNLSDGFVLPGVRSQPRKFTVDTTATQLRTDDGQAFVEINTTTRNIKAQTTGNIAAQADGNITANASGSASITAPTITLNGAVTINGTITVA